MAQQPTQSRQPNTLRPIDWQQHAQHLQLMDPQFWTTRWKDKQTGWHQENINPLLQFYWPVLQLPEGSHVLVPCCGKSLDMLYLIEQKHHVSGLELSEDAALEFFAENQLGHTQQQLGHFQIFKANDIPLTLYVGDLFDIKKIELPAIDAIYDRAALIALNEKQRQAYSELLTGLCPDQVKMLLLSIEYDQAQRSPPPHNVPEEEIRSLYGEHFNIELLNRQDILEEGGKFQLAGVTKLDETSFLLTKDSSAFN